LARPFDVDELEKRGAGRLGRSRRAGALDEIEALLAKAETIRSVTTEAVSSVCAGYGFDSPGRIPRNRARLYQCYLEHCFEDGKLSAEESADLAHLQALLQLGPKEIARAQEAVTDVVYGAAVAEVLDDLRLDPEEEVFLRQLRHDLAISDREAEHIFEKEKFDARRRAMFRATSRDPDLVNRKDAAGDFVGRSETSFEDAVATALEQATVAVPALHWFEVIEIAGYVKDGKTSGWHVTIRAGIEHYVDEE
jgi:flavin-binding protein dodecin